MAKIEFNIKYRPEIESGKYKVVTSTNKPVRIVCWDRVAKDGQSKDLKLCVLISEDNGESCYYYHSSGEPWLGNRDGNLFILTDQPELTEFEQELMKIMEEEGAPIGADISEYTEGDIASIHSYSERLLALARKQLQPEIDAEIDKAYKNSDAVQYRRGKEDAQKDMPHWRRMYAGAGGSGDGRNLFLIKDGIDTYRLSPVIACDDDYLVLSELDKLPRM